MRISDWSSDVCSSDLPRARPCRAAGDAQLARQWRRRIAGPAAVRRLFRHQRNRALAQKPQPDRDPVRRRRSEEHTSELQSLMRISYAVFCLKKKKATPIHEDAWDGNQNKTSINT